MKRMKKLMALVIAVAMVLGMSTIVLAAPGDMLSEPETTISATNLTEGDSIGYFQLVKWVAGDGWTLTETGQACGVTLEGLIDGISEAEATTIASNVTGAGTSMNVSGTTATAEVDPGLYFLRAVSADNNTIYNPAFVSADYYEGNNAVDLTSSYGNSSVLKKSPIPFDKEVTGADNFVDTKPGDIIPFKISTTVPSYGSSYTAPVFTITDTLSAGLALEGDVTVKYVDYSGEEPEATTTTQSVEDVVTITKGTPSNGFTVKFEEDYLLGLKGAMPTIEVTYSAKVTTEALNNVTYMDNKAKLTYSNKPGSTSDKDDITRHYTFSIDANMNGGNHGNEKTRELIKIGVDDNGQVITDFTSWVEGQAWTTYTPLGGAKFTLTDASGKTWTTESTNQGYISFNGLDAGTYKLVETEAPEGYVKDSTEHTVVITPTYKSDEPDVLVSYTVTVDGNDGSTYTISNMSDAEATVETTVTDGALTFPFVNKKGTELPTTGGIGTTIFYIVGAILVIGGGILLVSRRRMSSN